MNENPKVGDVVCLRSSGPWMTVYAERMTAHGPILDVVWFDGNTLMTSSAPPSAFLVKEQPAPRETVQMSEPRRFSECLPPNELAYVLILDPSSRRPWWCPWNKEPGYSWFTEYQVHSNTLDRHLWVAPPPHPTITQPPASS